MELFRLLITDLTEYGTLRCVAGWDLDRGKMIRPEPCREGFWEQTACGEGRTFAPGHIVSFSAIVPDPKTALPHLNEDRVVKSLIKVEEVLRADKFIEALQGVGAVDASTAFSAPMVTANSKAFVPTGTDHPSLRGLLVTSKSVEFFEERWGTKPAKPRCLINAPAFGKINLSIASASLRQLFRTTGIKGVRELFAGNQNLHIRLGLARGFDPFPNRCYMQINAIYRLS